MNSFPWDSLVDRLDEDGYPVYDRTYKAEDLREVYETFFSNGVFDGSPAPFLVTPGSGMSVLVSGGKCHIQGAIGYELSTRTVAITAATSQPRIDTVVLRWDSRRDARSIDLYVVHGAAADRPTRPALTRSEDVWELGIADIYIPQGTGTITADRITDTRLQTDRCGIVAPFAKFDTTGLFNQIQNAIDTNIADLERQTQIAIDLAQSAIGGTVAGDLLQKIGEKVDRSGDAMTGPLTIGTEAAGVDENYFACFRDDSSRPGGNPCRVALGISSHGEGFVNTGYFNDAGTFTPYNALDLRQDSTTLKKPLTVASGGTGATSAGDACNNLIRGRPISPRYIELGTGAANQNNGGFIDFHYNQSSGDYTSRIIETASGLIDINGTTFKRGVGLPIANGGTGATTLAGAQSNLKVPSAQRVSKSFSLNSGHLTGSVNYYMRGGVAVLDLVANRVAGGSISNGSRSTGIVLPANMRPPYTIRSSALAPINNYPDPMPSVFFAVDSAGAVHVSYTAPIAPASGYTWTFMGQLVICNGVG